MLLTILALTGCRFGTDAIARIVPDHADRYGRHYIQLIVSGHVDSAELLLPAEVPHDTAREILRQLSVKMAVARLDSVPIVGAQVTTSVMADGSTEVSRRIGYLVPIDHEWILFVVAMTEKAGIRQLTGFHYDFYESDPRVLSQFTFAGKGPGYYLFLLLAAACFSMAVTTAVWVSRQRGLPKRWLWVFVSLIGVGTVTLDWSSGGFEQRYFNFLLFCFGAAKGGLIDPWIFSFAFPAGAFVAIARAKKWRKEVAAAPALPSAFSEAVPQSE
jgi:hypothetical protein